jgi:fibronectin-binding autotransporter adhesin
VQFDASGIALSGGSLVNGNTTAALTAYVSNSSDNATLATSINDGGKGFAKDGSGTLVLSGTQTDVTGGITVTNGTLQTDAGVISGKTITNNATLELTAGTYSAGTITNAGTLLKSGTGTLTLNTAMSGSGATTITGGTLTTGVNQAIAAGALNISGGSTLDLATRDATVSALTLTGSSITNAGTLTLGASANLTTLASPTTSTIGGATLALGNTSHSFSIADGSAASDLTISAGLTGTSAGTLTKSGNGTLTLSGNNSLYAGNITMGTNSGLLIVDHANALGSGVTKFNGGTLTGNGTTLSLLGNTYQLQGSGGTIGGNSDLTLNGNWTDTGATNLNLSITNTGNTTLAGNFTISAAKTISTIVGTNLTMTGILSGAGSGLTKSGTGTLTLSGANTYTGNTTITNGTLKLGASNVIADTVNVIINAIAGATATFDLDGNSDTFASLTFGGTSGTATSTSNLSTGAGTLTLGGNLTYDATNHPLGSTLSGKLDLGASRTFAIGDSTNAATDLAVSANISGTGFSLTKTGAGTLALSGTNTYSGGTTVSAGVIAANSSTALGTGVTTIDNTGTVAIPTAVKINSNFTVNSGGTLTGTGTAALGGIVNGPGGTLAGTLTFASGSSLAPGSSPGLLNITGAVTFASGSRYTWELGAFSTATPGTNFDQVIIANGGSLSLLAGATLVPTFTGTATSPTAGNGFWTSAQTWTVVTNSGGTGTVTGTAFSIDNSAWSGSGNFATALSNNEVLLTWTPSAIPEPSTYAAIMGALALGATIWRRRHRHCR